MDKEYEVKCYFNEQGVSLKELIIEYLLMENNDE